MYRCDNDTIVPVEDNCSGVAPPTCQRTGETIVSLADDSSCCPQKVCGGSHTVKPPPSETREAKSDSEV